jgi:cytochrome P450
MLPPGPRAPAAIQTLAWWNRTIPFLERCRARYGRRFTIRLLGTPPFVMISEPEQIREVFTAPADVLHPGEGARVLEPIVGVNSVILLDESRHLEQRKLMLPAFHGERMQRLTGLMADVAEREVAAWPRDEPIDLHPRLQALTLEVILRAVFGLDPGERLDAVRSRLTEMLDFGARPSSLIPAMQVAFGHHGRWARFERVREETDELLLELIAERRAEEDEERDDILTMLLSARHEDGSPMSPQELRDELMTLLVAGHETTASQLAWAFERLARSPRVAGRLTGAIDEDGEEYLEATIREVMRRRPVIPNAAPRLVKQPIEIGGWTYPPGVCLVANAYLVHHDAEVYPEPYDFRPERFLQSDPGTYAWIPFGGGRRRCLGASFAMLEMRLILRAVLGSSEIRVERAAHEIARRRAITLSPRRGARTIVVDRVPPPVAAAA